MGSSICFPFQQLQQPGLLFSQVWTTDGAGGDPSQVCGPSRWLDAKGTSREALAPWSCMQREISCDLVGSLREDEEGAFVFDGRCVLSCPKPGPLELILSMTGNQGRGHWSPIAGIGSCPCHTRWDLEHIACLCGLASSGVGRPEDVLSVGGCRIDLADACQGPACVCA